MYLIEKDREMSEGGGTEAEAEADSRWAGTLTWGSTAELWNEDRSELKADA